MYAEYRFLRSGGGYPAFARVGVDAEPSSDDRIIVVDAIRNADQKKGEVDRGEFPDWISAAIDGARDTLTYLQQTNAITGGKASVTRVIGAIIDTNEQAVRCAAALATWKAITTARLPPMAFENGHWLVKWDR